MFPKFQYMIAFTYYVDVSSFIFMNLNIFSSLNFPKSLLSRALSFVCSHATGHIFHSIDLKLWGYTCTRKSSGGIVFRQNRIQDGGCGGHFVSEKLLKNSQKLQFSIKSIQNLDLSYEMYLTPNCRVSEW